MNCRYVQSRLSAYLDFELSGVEQQQIRNHLEQCIECSRELESLRITKVLLQQLPVVVPSSRGAERVLQRLQAQAAPAPQRFRMLNWRRTRWWQFAGGFALAVALAFWSRTEPERPFYVTSSPVSLTSLSSETAFSRTNFFPHQSTLHRASSLQGVLVYVHRSPQALHASPASLPVVPVAYPADPLLEHYPASYWNTLIINAESTFSSR